MIERAKQATALMLALTLAAGGCTWKSIEGDPASHVRAEAPDRVRATTLDGRERVLRNPQVRDGVLVGATASVPLDSVRRLERRGADVGRIVGVGVGAAAGVAAFVLFGGGDDGGGDGGGFFPND